MNRDAQPYFVISVVSKMLDIHPQTIRHYERLGLITPHRTEGNIRLYSRRDIDRLEQICSFTNLGVNLAGVEVIVSLLEKMETAKNEMRREMQKMTEEIMQLNDELKKLREGSDK
ncbi:MAG: MerR family transcriptional regulator [bacterium]|nr:MerR family transcriptional regulator [bacterium]